VGFSRTSIYAVEGKPNRSIFGPADIHDVREGAVTLSSLAEKLDELERASLSQRCSLVSDSVTMAA
jgi:hypothetical protein